ncbi:MAG: hypothetical protein DMF72_11690 [Acidobacteria bacterium]|nr:MAG: hypothetical protein DMF72_11690 [Acidobacteriota bacterium]
MTKIGNHVLAIAMLLVSGALAFGQQPKPAPTPPATPEGQERPEIINIRRVRLPITVTDKKGLFVPGLTQRDFVVLEDKVPQQIDSFTSEESNNLPLYVGVLMDTSPSTAGKLKFEQESAMNFIQTVVRPRKDRVLFATFDDQVTPAQGRRALVIITDGDDTYSRADINDAIDIAQRTETTIFAISTKAGLSGSVPGVEAGQVSDHGDKGLERLCDETGGMAFFTGDMLALERSFSKIAKELRSQYLITYKPTNDHYDGSYRKVDVKLLSPNDKFKLRTKRGYKAVSDSVTTK